MRYKGPVKGVVETKGSGLLKFAGVLLIIGGVLGILLGLVALLGLAAWAGITGNDYASDLPYITGAFTLISAVLQLIAGIVGIKNCKKAEKAGVCIVWGVVVIALSVIGSIISVAGGNAFPAATFFLGLILPALYITGAVKNRAA